ncbi:MAG: type II toxin-antitoxin system antitoxin, RelB/DinJ family [Lachnobacterium sp.]|nr:type II toxin-antitoxin system antitoxin, RelB/DinJ family [Lachnobacterium sp.]
MISTILIRVEDKLNTKPEILFKDLDADTTTTPYTPLTEEEILAKLRKSREQGRFRDADDVISDMRSKYGL